MDQNFTMVRTLKIDFGKLRSSLIVIQIFIGITHDKQSVKP